LGTVPVTGITGDKVTVDLSTLPAAVTAAGAGTYYVKTTDGTIYSTPASVNVGSGYNVADPPPNVSFSAGPTGTLTVASTAINTNGTLGIGFAGNPAAPGGPVTVTVDNGSVSGPTQVKGLMNSNLDLWDFSQADFTRYIQVVANVVAVNGAESSSLTFSQNLLSNNFENLELATGRITDTDVAHEMAQVVKNRIKTSTAADMLAKHNKLGMMVDLTIMNLT